MIEDFQDDFSSYTHTGGKRQNHSEQGRPFAMFLVVFAAWVVFATVFLLVSLPKVRNTLAETNAVEVWHNRKQIERMSGTVKVPLVFVNASNGTAKLEKSYAFVKITGETTFHDAIEGLLLGPSSDALKNGSISFITKGTELIGLTVSGSYVFVDFSEQFLSSGQEWGSLGLSYAKAQVVQTIKLVDSSITDVVFLINGSEI